MSKISLNPKYTNVSNYSWSTTTYNDLEFYISTNKTDSSVSTLKCEFTTPYDNIDITVEIGASSESNYDWCYIGQLDNSSPTYNNNYLDRISGYSTSNYNPTFKEITINVGTAGTHFLIIGYHKDNSNSIGKDCGYFRLATTEVDKPKITPYIYCGTKTTPESILANNKDINEVYVGSELIWSKPNTLWFHEFNGEIKFAKKSLVGADTVTIPGNTYDKFSYGNNIIPGSNYFESGAYYGLNVRKLISNGYIYIINYTRAMDMSVFPNPIDMDYRYGGNLSSTCRYLKINPKLNKETTNLYRMLISFNSDRSDNDTILNQPLTNHEACNIVRLDKLNTGNVTYMSGMMQNSNIFGNLDFSKWDTSKVTDMSYMFYYASGLNENKYNNIYRIQNYSYFTGLNNWNLKSIKDMSHMFESSTYYDFQDEELTWNTYNATDLSFMFAYTNAYHFPKLSFDTRNVTNMSYMFKRFVSYNDLKLNFTDTSKVTDMSGMFSGRRNIYSPKYYFSYLNYHGDADISCLDTSNVVNASNMFNCCTYLTPDMIKNIRLPKATNIKNLFFSAYMGGWDFVNKKNTYIDTIDLSNLDLGSINNFDEMEHAFAFGGYKYYSDDDDPINTYINNLILDNWKCFKDDESTHDIYLSISPFYGCNVTYCYIRGCNYNTKQKIKQMLGNYSNTYASCTYFIED